MAWKKGCDVSEFQAPDLVPWNDYQFAIVRLAYGTMLDKRSVQHAHAAKTGGALVGGYQFFRPDQKLDAQFEILRYQMGACGLGDGSVVPALDVERYPDRWGYGRPLHWAEVAESWCEPTLRYLEMIAGEYGNVIAYMTQRDWTMLGRPQQVLKYPLWVANYPARGATSPLRAPATPGNSPWTIWQYMVGPLGQTLQNDRDPKAVDQNFCSGELPLIGATEQTTSIDSPVSLIPLLLDDDYWAEHTACRDKQILQEDFPT